MPLTDISGVPGGTISSAPLPGNVAVSRVGRYAVAARRAEPDAARLVSLEAKYWLPACPPCAPTSKLDVGYCADRLRRAMLTAISVCVIRGAVAVTACSCEAETNPPREGDPPLWEYPYP